MKRSNRNRNNRKRSERAKRTARNQPTCKHPTQKKKYSGLVVGIIVVILLVATAGTLFFMQMQKGKDSSQTQVKKDYVASNSEGSKVGSGETITYEGQRYEYNKDIKTLVFLGVDKKGDMDYAQYMGDGGQADSIVLMALNEKEKTMQLFQISRNTMTNVDVYSDRGEYLTTQQMQIALQYAYGDGEKKSAWLMKKTLSNLLYGVPIDSSISMSIDGISTVNDLLGGVEVTMTKDYTYVDPAFEEGKTMTLTGAQAEKYVRYRDITVTGSNNDRMERQTQFVMALMSQLKRSSQRDTELYSKLMTGTNPYFSTDMDADEIMELSEYEMDGDIQSFPGEEKAGEKHDEFYTDDKELEKIIVKTFYKLIHV